MGRFLRQKAATEIRVKTFPVMDLLLPDGRHYSTEALAGTPVNKIVVLFDPECEHCRYELHQLLDNADKFSNASILFISQEPVLSLRSFQQELEKAARSNVLVASIDPGVLFKRFAIRSFPEIYLYGKNNKEVSKHTGETPATLLLSEIP
jgi:hypothetical protein